MAQPASHACLLVLDRDTALSAGDPVVGGGFFGRCAACHTRTAGQNKVGRRSRRVRKRERHRAGFAYSAALKSAHVTGTTRRSISGYKIPQASFAHHDVPSVPSGDDRQILSLLKTLSAPGSSACCHP